MKIFVCLFVLCFTGVSHAAEEAVDPGRMANMVILDKAGVEALGIETVEVEESVFEETAFAIGRIEEIPARHAVLSSRIPGRVVELNAQEGDVVVAGQSLMRVESRQPGDPPPTIELKAPVGGLIVLSHVRLGEPVEPDRELLDISDMSSVWAVARVPEFQAGRLKVGSKARITVAALGDQVLEGEMLRFGTSADRMSGTIDAIFKVENPGMRMRPGMRAEFQIVVDRDDGVMSVPRAALQGDPANRHVFVRDFDLPDAFLKSAVRTGRVSGERVEILSGVFPGDEVVTHGSYPLGFVGGGGVSLKEALDAAHGHEHNEDGTIKTDAGEGEEAAGDAGGGGGGGGKVSWRERFFMGTSGLLAVLLVVQSVMTRRGSERGGKD
ncbi:MAG: efflux RND transporter periplasmic adaptor subunit [Verrucomicrobiales bacterium]|nr:efflux RND transporter periplasmic adaptor subunit [Verrucomicrobiota bacterium JB025]